MKKPIKDNKGKVVEIEESHHATLIELFGYSAIPDEPAKQESTEQPKFIQKGKKKK